MTLVYVDADVLDRLAAAAADAENALRDAVGRADAAAGRAPWSGWDTGRYLWARGELAAASGELDRDAATLRSIATQTRQLAPSGLATPGRIAEGSASAGQIAGALARGDLLAAAAMLGLPSAALAEIWAEVARGDLGGAAQLLRARLEATTGRTARTSGGLTESEIAGVNIGANGTASPVVSAVALQLFTSKYSGHFVDFIHDQWPNQCMDLAAQYNHDVIGAPPLQGNPVDIWNRGTDPTGYKLIGLTSGATPQPGDLILWGGTADNGGFGHIGIYESGSSTSFTSLDQNYPTRSATQPVPHTYANVVGWLHPISALGPTATTASSVDPSSEELAGASASLRPGKVPEQ